MPAKGESTYQRVGWPVYWRSIYDGSLQEHWRDYTPLWLWEYRHITDRKGH